MGNTKNGQCSSVECHTWVAVILNKAGYSIQATYGHMLMLIEMEICTVFHIYARGW